MEKSKFIKANEKIAEKVVNVYKAVEGAAIEGYGKVESAAVEGYEKVENAFVNRFLAREGETLEEAKARLKAGGEGQ